MFDLSWCRGHLEARAGGIEAAGHGTALTVRFTAELTCSSRITMAHEGLP